MLPLNGTLALYSALASTGIFTCDINDVATLYSPSSASPIMYFECLVITGLAHPSYCDTGFYNVLTSSCISCTFSTLTASYLPCFNQCSTVATGDFCANCTTTYISQWHTACAPTIPISLPNLVDFTASCIVSSFDVYGGLNLLAADMTNCLALNVTRDVECMAALGYVNLDPNCSDCIFGVQAVTDAACESVCVGRPFSSLCRKCVSTYVQINTASCFKSDLFTIAVDSPCVDSDLALIGSNASHAIPITNNCITAQSCGSVAFSTSNTSFVSSQCAICLDSAAVSLCSTYCEPAASLLDCVGTPVVDPQPETPHSLCLFEDMSFFYSKSSPIMAEVNGCLYESTDSSLCFDPIYPVVSSSCSACFRSNIAVNLDCSQACPTDTSGEDQTVVVVKSAPCQACLALAFAETVQDCFSTGTVNACDVETIAALSFDPWGEAFFVRCLLSSNFTKQQVSNCYDEFSLAPPKTSCRECMSEKIVSVYGIYCETVCISASSDTCRSCVSNLPASAAKTCSTSSLILQGSSPSSKGALLPSITAVAALVLGL